MKKHVLYIPRKRIKGKGATYIIIDEAAPITEKQLEQVESHLRRRKTREARTQS